MVEISENAARRIAQSVTASERLKYSSISKIGNGPTTNFGSPIVKTPSGGIPARSGNTAGHATCVIQSLDKSTYGLSVGEDLEVINLSSTAVAGDIYVSAIRDRQGNYAADISGSSGSSSFSPAWCKITSSGDIDDSPTTIISDFETSDDTVFDWNETSTSPVTTVGRSIALVSGVWTYKWSHANFYFVRSNPAAVPTSYVGIIQSGVGNRKIQLEDGASSESHLERRIDPLRSVVDISTNAPSTPDSNQPEMESGFSHSTIIPSGEDVFPKINLNGANPLLTPFQEESFTMETILIQTELGTLA